MSASLRLQVRPQMLPTTRYEQRQARFHTVFENAPLGQKILTSNLTIRQVHQALVDLLGCTKA